MFTFWCTDVTDYSDIGKISVFGGFILWYEKYGVCLWQHQGTYSLRLPPKLICIVFCHIFWL